MSTYAIHQGDVLAWCRDYAQQIARGEAEPFHSVFCDWPYLLSFMGAGMRDAPHHVYLDEHPEDVDRLVRLLGVEDWEAAAVLWYRDVARGLASVCYPGAQHLGFGGARTDDLLAMGLRAAGWIVQDKLLYMYGSAMPHGLDLARAIDERRVEDLPGIYRVTEFVRKARDRAGLTNAQIDEAFGTRGMAGHWTSAASQPAVPKPDQWEQLKALLGLGDEMDAEVARLNSRKGEAGDNYKARKVIGIKRDGGKRRVPIMTSKHEHYTVTAAHTPEAVAWEGYNTHLKPAYETLVYAYLPGAGSFAETALRYGTGGLFIDGARIGNEEHGRGRWPANVALEHAPACDELGACVADCPVALLDEQSGVTTSRAGDRGDHTRHEPKSYAGDRTVAGSSTGVRGYTDQGGASRFYYTAKAAEWERNAGLEGGEAHLQRRTNPGGLENEPRWAPKLSHNPHPTLKAIRPLIYFATLLRRPVSVAGRLLVPFSGSGSEMIGALMAGWEYVQGIELDQDAMFPGIFVDIARRRIEWWLQFDDYDQAAEAMRDGRAALRALPPPERRLVQLPKPDRVLAFPRKTARPPVEYRQDSLFD